MILALPLLGALLVTVTGHESENPLYRELRQSGVVVGPGETAPLPEPAMPDGLDKNAQLEALKEVIGQDYSLNDFVRPSTVAPLKLKLRDIEPTNPNAPARGMDVYFVTQGDLETVASQKFLNRNLDQHRGEGDAHALTAEDLAHRGMARESENQEHEGYTHLVYSLLDRVQISSVVHSVWSRTEDSLLMAGQIDPRFLGDEQYPNQWRSIERRRGRNELGGPRPYDTAGYYVKITRLAEPEGALFVEGHLIFTEPQGWFNGANLLRSKLPPVIQSQVRDFRRDLIKASR